MTKCDAYFERQQKNYKADPILHNVSPVIETLGFCMGTKNVEQVDCGGNCDSRKCVYAGKRKNKETGLAEKKAKKKNILDKALEMYGNDISGNAGLFDKALTEMIEDNIDIDPWKLVSVWTCANESEKKKLDKAIFAITGYNLSEILKEAAKEADFWEGGDEE